MSLYYENLFKCPRISDGPEAVSGTLSGAGKRHVPVGHRPGLVGCVHGGRGLVGRAATHGLALGRGCEARPLQQASDMDRGWIQRDSNPYAKEVATVTDFNAAKCSGCLNLSMATRLAILFWYL